ncbi:OmpA family protein [Sphingomonas paeninsulae]|uniref:OmpA family protein n=1 Tax=Sphingomonas paeninsulae TaxID=2319844 RepID=UPI001EEF7F24|nr:OmpA family protein [Sphingomonas paeninsulae]
MFRQDSDAPDSRFVASGPESKFGEALSAGSTFRLAEIPPEKLQSTEVLLSELKATQTPDQSIAIDLPTDVLFDFDKAVLRPDANEPLSRAAQLIASYPEAPLLVNGHTDGKGSDAYNDPLSMKRATAVAQWLKQSTGRTPAAAGLGKRHPVAPNVQPNGTDDPEGRQRNRRVEILIRPLVPIR